MSKICTRCGKGPMSGNNVSHSHHKTRRRWLPNLQKSTQVDENGNKQQVKICTRCLRTLRKKGVAV